MTIELGIVVVYMVSEGNERLLDLHLDRIERHTTVPYAIHGSVIRLLPQCRTTLERHSRVSLHECPPTDLRGSEEHSYYLERLVRLAIEGGASHIAILHADSFPIRDGWVEELVGRLSESSVFVTIEGINTACLLFNRDFYLGYRPPFLLSQEQRQSPAYATIIRDAGLELQHSGTGFGFEAHRQGVGWYSMRKSSRDESGRAAIYDDLLFHLKGALSLTFQLQKSLRRSEVPSRKIPELSRRLGPSRFEGFLRGVRAVVPPRLRQHLRARLGRTLGSLIDEPRLRWHAEARDRLLDDPESFIENLRGNG